jgi:primosomal protein N'
MAGKMCPNPKCGKQTFFETPTGRQCSRCGYTMTLPANEGKGGQGKRCSRCGENKVRDGNCRGCGAKYFFK